MSNARDRVKLERKDKSYYQPDATMTPEYVNHHFPVIGLRVYQSGVQVIRGSNKPLPPKKTENDKRGQITHLSPKSMSRLAFLTREKSKMFNSLLTVTYGDISPRDGRQLKVELRRMLKYLRRRYRAQYVWFLEFTKAGRPHVHILMDYAPSIVDRFYMADFWANGVAIEWPTDLNMGFQSQVEIRNKMFKVHFHKATWEILRKKDGAARYVTKYATKLIQKRVPKNFADVGRFWGASKEISLGDPEYTIDVTEDDLRAWLINTMDRDLEYMDILPKFIYIYHDDPDESVGWTARPDELDT